MANSVSPAPMQIVPTDHPGQRHDQPWDEVELAHAHHVAYRPNLRWFRPPLLGLIVMDKFNEKEMVAGFLSSPQNCAKSAAPFGIQLGPAGVIHPHGG